MKLKRVPQAKNPVVQLSLAGWTRDAIVQATGIATERVDVLGWGRCEATEAEAIALAALDDVPPPGLEHRGSRAWQKGNRVHVAPEDGADVAACVPAAPVASRCVPLADLCEVLYASQCGADEDEERLVRRASRSPERG